MSEGCWWSSNQADRETSRHSQLWRVQSPQSKGGNGSTPPDTLETPWNAALSLSVVINCKLVLADSNWSVNSSSSLSRCKNRKLAHAWNPCLGDLPSPQTAGKALHSKLLSAWLLSQTIFKLLRQVVASEVSHCYCEVSTGGKEWNSLLSERQKVHAISLRLFWLL